MEFAQKLKALREAAGLSQDELAKRAGMHRFGISKLEQGLRRPSWDTVQALARALGVKCEAFEQEPTAIPTEKPGPGRPRKAAAEPAEPQVKRPRGRPRKES